MTFQSWTLFAKRTSKDAFSLMMISQERKQTKWVVKRTESFREPNSKLIELTLLFVTIMTISKDSNNECRRGSSKARLYQNHSSCGQWSDQSSDQWKSFRVPQMAMKAVSIIVSTVAQVTTHGMNLEVLTSELCPSLPTNTHLHLNSSPRRPIIRHICYPFMNPCALQSVPKIPRTLQSAFKCFKEESDRNLLHHWEGKSDSRCLKNSKTFIVWNNMSNASTAERLIMGGNASVKVARRAMLSIIGLYRRSQRLSDL